MVGGFGLSCVVCRCHGSSICRSTQAVVANRHIGSVFDRTPGGRLSRENEYSSRDTGVPERVRRESGYQIVIVVGRRKARQSS